MMPHHWRPLAHERNSISKCKQHTINDSWGLEKELYDTFTENIINHNLEQMVKIPTRNNNILDLFLTKHTKSSSWKQNVISTSIKHIRSGYCISRNQCQTRWHQAKPHTGKSYKKAIIGLTLRKTWTSSLFTTHKQKDPNHHWDMFKAEVNRLSTLHIPTRQINSSPHQLRNSQTQKKKRQTVHKTGKVMFTQKSLHWKVLTSQVIQQKQIRNAYWSYLESVIFSDTQVPGHKKKTENIGIAPLNSGGQTHSDPVSKPNILNTQFESVFSRPSPLRLEQLAKSATSKLGHATNHYHSSMSW